MKDGLKTSQTLSVWPSCKHLSSIDPNCLAASLWLRAQGYQYSLININRQIPMLLGVYPTLHDTTTNRHYVGFEAIYEQYRREQPSADELALVALFKRLFVPAFMHSQWLDEANRLSFRTLYHYTIGLPTSFFHIRKKLAFAHSWTNIFSKKVENDSYNQTYDDAQRCLTVFEEKLSTANHRFINGDKFSLIDAWVGGYLLVIHYHASEKSKLKTMLLHFPQLMNYIKRCDDVQQYTLTKENDESSLPKDYSTDNAMDIVSILHIISQIASFSIFFFMLTKIGANSYITKSS